MWCIVSQHRQKVLRAIKYKKKKWKGDKQRAVDRMFSHTNRNLAAADV